MRILVALDSFKSAINQVMAVEAVMRGLVAGYGSGIEVDMCPLADGGEGSGLLLARQGGSHQPLEVVDAYGRPRDASWILWKNIALVEAAQGSAYLPPHERPINGHKVTTSRGTGQLIRAAFNDPRVMELWVALGGTGSVDGGIGLLGELGFKFFDAHSERLPPTMDSLSRIARVERAVLPKPVVGLPDVLVPLLGVNGAVQGFGPQKGLAVQDLGQVENALRHYAQALDSKSMAIPGAGSAGGMGFALLVAGARLEPGASWWGRWSQLDERVAKADVVITGEGRLDNQSLWGKVVSTVFASAQRHNKRVVVLAGQIPHDLEPFYRKGMWIALPIGTGPASLSEAMARTEKDIEATAVTLGRIFKDISNL